MILELALTAVLHGAPAREHPPRCERATISENSGNGPAYRVVICSALVPLRAHDQRWDLIVDGGPLQNGAVIIGERVPA